MCQQIGHMYYFESSTLSDIKPTRGPINYVQLCMDHDQLVLLSSALKSSVNWRGAICRQVPTHGNPATVPEIDLYASYMTGEP